MFSHIADNNDGQLSQERNKRLQPALACLGFAALLLTTFACSRAAAAQSPKPDQPAPPASSLPQAPDCSPSWTAVTSPNAMPGTETLRAVTELSANDVWAAGDYTVTVVTITYNLPLFEHWDGAKWKVVAGGTLPTNVQIAWIYGISAVSANDVWAVGTDFNGSINHALTEHWNGTQWDVVPAAAPTAYGAAFHGVTAVAADAVWAVGDFVNASANYRNLIEKWNGTSWSVVTSPNMGTGENFLISIASVPGSSGNDMWAVGYYSSTSDGYDHTLALRYNGTSWAIVTSYSVPSNHNYLESVSALSTNDVWAVGYYANSTYTAGGTLAEHWNGTAWSISPTVDPGGGANALNGVVAISPSDVWAVGSNTANPPSGTTKAIREHWDGTVWSAVLDSNTGNLYGVAAGSSSDVWAVGNYYATSQGFQQLLTEHYNGSAWSLVYSPVAPANYQYLFSVSAISSNDIWAVGGYDTNNNDGYKTLIEHWNGTAWSIVPSPNAGTYSSLNSVAALSASDAWAVGYYDAGTRDKTLIERWNGTSWNVITSPNGSTGNNVLTGIAVASSNDAWAVGTYFDTGTNSYLTLTLHWNGIAWLQAASPDTTGYYNSLFAVAVVPGSSGQNVWAVGNYEATNGSHQQTLVERWNGSQWSIVPSPNVPSSDNRLYAVQAFAANDIWAIGASVNNQATPPERTLALHWNGTAWSIVSTPNPGSLSSELRGLVGASSSDIYAVGGSFTATFQFQTLVEHWNGTAWSVVPSIPNPDFGGELYGAALAPVSSSTDLWAAGYYSDAGSGRDQTLIERYNPCPTTCTIQFTDVLPGSTFYQYVRCMACRNIINGYTSGCGTGNPCFRPNANVTRGQLSKIVANSAGFNDPQPNQMFGDVPVGSTFQLFIGRLASRGYISGYPCGGVGEPCHSGNLPYFRPNANATRGQISKINSNAAGFSNAPSGRQFQDVPVGSTYYTYTYRLVSRSIMSGYQCGGGGEPCIPPANLPYFRPNNNATRGQTSKIVANTFFPNCQTADLRR